MYDNVKKNWKEILPPMPNEWQEELFKMFKIRDAVNEHGMLTFLIKWLLKNNLEFEVDPIGNILVDKSDKRKFCPCIVAHMDTVHRDAYDVEIKLKKVKKFTMATAWSKSKQVGTGGDDRNGILAAMYMLLHVDNIKAVFFTQEETGLVGSNLVDLDWFFNVGYIMQLDRWGRNDFICEHYGEFTISNDFYFDAEPVLDKYAYVPTSGLYTDSINLWSNNIGVSCVNISCGYYQHHTTVEYVVLEELWNSIMFTKELIDTLGNTFYPSEPAHKFRSSKSYSATTKSDTYTTKKPKDTTSQKKSKKEKSKSAGQAWGDTWEDLEDYANNSYWH